MSLVMSEKDKKLLSILISIILIAAFIFLVFRPLILQNQKLEEEAVKIRTQAADLDDKAKQTEEMLNQEKSMGEEMELILARYYPFMQSQQVEGMATTLMLNHGLDIQSLTIVMPERESTLKWYQYSANAITEQAATPKEGQEELLELYVARVTCVADGTPSQVWALIDDISAHYPAISIANTEWAENRLTLTLEVYMSNR